MYDVTIKGTKNKRVQIDVDAWDHTFYLSESDREQLDIHLPEDGSELVLRIALDKS